ncbi:family S53 protease [Athelia psychrophila]|uniref:Family S53 protease n=1 Tax=Athelia psychrophila TaxID=1759441 RepID=A0A166FPP0_9AGAM|nr:family S53 protease [Fibularhizoctonia sp. CBS 109695]
MLSSTTVFLALLASAWAAPASWAVHESRDSAPQGFVRSSAAPADHVISMRINLAQGNLAGLESALRAASSPSSPTFRQWLSTEQVNAYAKPTTETTDAVTKWLSTNNVDYKLATVAGDWLSFEVPVSTASQLFNANFSTYTHIATNQTSVRTLQYSLPAAVQGHINAVTPTTSFSKRSRLPSVLSPANAKRAAAASSATIPSDCSSAITPTCLQDLYNIPATAATNKNNSLGVLAMGDQYANKADLADFLTEYRTDMSSATTFALTTLDGGSNSQNASMAGTEANLDIQYTVGIATGVPVTLVAVGDTFQDGDNQGFLDTITTLLAETSPPLVLTTSYGLPVESDLSRSLSIALCNAYMQLTARGVSILFATGDGGVAASPDANCTTFQPSFPTCPYVTLVGATSGVPETGADLSAGGFSNYFGTTSWQADDVAGYLEILGTEYSGKYNRTGRAYPDVSAQGVNVQVYVNGTINPSPIFSSVVALINEQLLNAGKSLLGFLNPWLYANPGAFNDITTGSNPGCGTSGFPAAKGWDPVTGLGSPNYTALLAAANV